MRRPYSSMGYATASSTTEVLWAGETLTVGAHGKAVGTLIPMIRVDGVARMLGDATGTGIQGPPGPTGPQGPKGDTGATGPAGPAGPTGPAGTNGEKWWTGAGVPAAGLGATGDLYLDTATGDVYDKASGAWVKVGNIKGPVGATGPAGPTGATGPAGAAGAAGAAGTPGEKWWVGATNPVVATGINGDLALNSVTGDVFEKQAGAWVLVGNIKGPPGQNTSGDNALLNASFEAWTSPATPPASTRPDGAPYNWSLFWQTAAQGIIKKALGRDVTAIEWDSVAGAGSTQSFLSSDIVVAPGQTWYVSAYAKSGSLALPVTFDAQVLSSPTPNPAPFGSGVHAQSVIAASAVGSTDWVFYEGQITIPAGDLYAALLYRFTAPAPGGAVGILDLTLAKNLNPAAGSLPAYPKYGTLAGLPDSALVAGLTPTYGWPYPGEATPPDVPKDIKALALAIEADFADTGYISGSALWTPTATYTDASGSRGRKIGNRVHLELAIVRGVSNLVAAANGAMVSAVGTMAAGWRPTTGLRFTWATSLGSGIFTINAAGDIVIQNGWPGAVIAQNSTAWLTADYFTD